MTVNLKHAINEVIVGHGHAAPIFELAAAMGWQARWAPSNQQDRMARVAQLLVEAGEITQQLEKEEAAEREDSKS